MRKKVLTFTLLLLVIFIAPLVYTQDLSKRQPDNKSSTASLMSDMILELSKKSKPVSDNRMFENDLNLDQAQYLLTQVNKIKQNNPPSHYKRGLIELENNVKNLIKALQNKDAKSKQLSQAVFDSCFSCHLTHRQK